MGGFLIHWTNFLRQFKVNKKILFIKFILNVLFMVLIISNFQNQKSATNVDTFCFHKKMTNYRHYRIWYKFAL